MGSGIYLNLCVGFLILLATAVLASLLAPNRRLAGWVNFIGCLVSAVLFFHISLPVLFQGVVPGSQQVNLGFAKLFFLIDSFSALFILLISFMGALSAFYSIRYMDHYADYSLRSYYLNYPLFILGIVAIVTVDDLSIGFTIAWQLMTIASYFLIRFDHKQSGIIKSANKYLVLMEIAWVLILLGMLAIGSVTPGESIHHLKEKIGGVYSSRLLLIYAPILIGFALKAGVFPLGQLWLPDAHSVAPSPISALLSGVMIKTGVYGIIRTLFWMVPNIGPKAFDGQIWGLVVAVFGVVTLFIGTTQALKQHDAKRLHAYHSIGQMGYIILGIGTGLFFFSSQNELLKVLAAIALIGALYHTLNHTIFKGLLFLSTGSVQYATGLKDLDKLGGLIKLMPVTALVAGIASMSIAGVPAFSGFMSKWTIVSANILGGSQMVYFAFFGIVALLTSAITLASYVKFFGLTFTSAGIEWSTQKEIQEVPASMLAPKVILAVLCLVQGLFPYFFFKLFINIFKNSPDSLVQNLFQNVSSSQAVFSSGLGVTVTLPGINAVSAVAVPLILLALFVAIYLFVSYLKNAGGSTARAADVWLCGYQQLNDKNRYRSHGMYAAFKEFMHWTGGNPQ